MEEEGEDEKAGDSDDLEVCFSSVTAAQPSSSDPPLAIMPPAGVPKSSKNANVEPLQVRQPTTRGSKGVVVQSKLLALAGGYASAQGGSQAVENVRYVVFWSAGISGISSECLLRR